MLNSLVDEFGPEAITGKYDTAWNNGSCLSDGELSLEFEIEFPELAESRIYLPNYRRPSDEEFIKYKKSSIKHAWLDHRGTRCRLHNGTRQNGYPVCSVRTSSKDSEKIQLHQIPHWRKTGTFIVSPRVASHRCHIKRCIVCAVDESRSVNTDRNRCVAYSVVNDTLIVRCRHRPRCLKSGPQAYQ